MRKYVLAALPFAVLSGSALPANADTVVRRETVIIRDAPARVVERRYYATPRTTYVAPRRHYYTTAPRTYGYVDAGYYAPAPRYTGASTYYYNTPAYYYNPGYYYDTPGFTYTATNGCDAIYRRAVATGSSYWWNRYEDCVD